MQPAHTSFEIGHIKLHHRASNLELGISTTACFTSTLLDNTTLREQLASLIYGIDAAHNIYIDRSSQLVIVLEVTSPDIHLWETDKMCADISTTLSLAKIWSQLGWKCISNEREHVSAAITTIRLSFVNDNRTSQQKRTLHHIDQNVPFFDVKAPAETPKAQIVSIQWTIQIFDTKSEAIPQLDALSDNHRVEHKLDDQLMSSPLISGDDYLLQSQEVEVTLDDTRVLEQYSSSPLLGPDDIDSGSSCSILSSEVMDLDLGSSPPDIVEPPVKPLNNDNIALLLDLGIRSCIHGQGVRRPKAVSITRSEDFQSLALLAPSMFLPGFAAAMASRAPFLSRIGATLEACTTHGNGKLLPVSLWDKMRRHLEHKHSKTGLKSLRVQVEPSAVIAQSSDVDILGAHAPDADLASSSDCCSEDDFDNLL